MNKLLSVCLSLILISILPSCDRNATAERHVINMVSNTPEQQAQSDIILNILAAELASRYNQPDTAISHYMDAAQAARSPILAERAMALSIFAEKYDDALEAANTWLSLDPSSNPAKFSVAVLKLRTGEANDEAIERIIQGRNGQSKSFKRLSDMLSETFEPKEAYTKATTLLSKHLDDSRARTALASLAIRAQAYQEAESHLIEAIRLDKNNAEARELLSILMLQQEKPELAIEHLRYLIKHNPGNNQLRERFAKALLSAGNLDEAKTQFLQLHDISPHDATINYALGLLYYEERQDDKAEKHFGNLLFLNRLTNEAHYYLGRIAAQRQDFETAKSHLQKVHDPALETDTTVQLAELAFMQNQFKEGYLLLQKQLQKKPKKADEIYLSATLASGFEANGRYEDAFEIYSTQLEKYPDDSRLLYARAMISEQLNRLDVLEQDLLKIIEQNPESATALNALGYTLANKTNRLDEARKYITKAYELLPGEAAIIDSMGWLLFREGDINQAHVFIEKAFELHPDPEVAAHLGEILWIKGRQDKAQALWDQFSDNAYVIETRSRLEMQGAPSTSTLDKNPK